ncbi:MAG: alpha/beta hydrolase [Bacillota bacterium]|jgi:acetyl esterase/lipase|nr:alpha/beta hydrolase [Bacillota bacterium]HHU43438.1 alpha/beta hydrolase [Clostridiales bacterium]
MQILRNKRFLFIGFITIILLTALALASIAFVFSSTEVSVEICDKVRPEDFSIEDGVILIKHRGDIVKKIDVKKNMLSSEDLKKLSTPGRHTVTINYKKNKSVRTQVNLLRSTSKEVVIDKILAGLQKTAVYNNINGELELSAYFQKFNQPRKDFTLSLKFTLDVDQDGGAENYLGVELTQDGGVLLGIYYKDDTESRPYLYLKSDGPFIPIMDKTQNKLLSVSADEYFGVAKEPNEGEYWTYKGVMDTLMSFIDDKMTVSLVKTALNLLLTDAAVADDGTAATININFKKILEWLPIAALVPGVADMANDFLNSIDAGFNFVEAVSGIKEPPLLRIKALFENGELRSIDMTDLKNNSKVSNALSLDIDDKIQAGFNVEKISIKADDTWFSLPKDKGLEKWQEGDVSFERWVLLQYRRILGEPAKPPKRQGIEEYLDIDYIGDGSPFHKLDIYRPEIALGEKLPTIIHIHGGGWVHGRKEDTYSYCQYLALQGFTVVNINYHLLPYEVLPEPMQDIFAVFDFVMDPQNSEIYGIDRENLFLTGDSAGGHYAMLALSILADDKLLELYGVESDIKFNAAGVSSTGFTFTEILKLPIPFAHFYVNQFFCDDLPYTAYKDDPRYKDMAKTLNLENNKIEKFPPMFVSSAHGDIFKSHSERLVAELDKHGVEYVYDFRKSGDKDNPENFLLGHDFNISAPDWTASRAVNNKMCDFFKKYIV